MDRKTCSECLEEKEISEFSRESKTVKGKFYQYHKSRCKSCDKLYKADYYKKNKSLCNEKAAKYYANNREETKAKARAYAAENKEKISQSKKEYRKNPDYLRRARERSKQRRDSDPLYKLICNVRSRIKKVLKGWSKSASSEVLVGCSWEELKAHLESQFKEGMTWENHGNNGWHTDHVVPLSSAKTLEEIEKLCHYTNLQPLWWHENLSKGAKL